MITSAAAFGRDLEDPFEAPGLDSHPATELLAQAGSADGWYPRIDAPSNGRTVLDTSGHCPLFEQPDDFLDYLTDVVVPSTAQLPRS